MDKSNGNYRENDDLKFLFEKELMCKKFTMLDLTIKRIENVVWQSFHLFVSFFNLLEAVVKHGRKI